MSHVKAGGSAKNLKDSNAQFLGTKLYDGQKAKAGSIIVRQRGTKILAGKNTKVGKDHTIFALKDGIVKFTEKRKKSFTGSEKRLKIANVVTG
jgi:large subunit ribosomal protein L27